MPMGKGTYGKTKGRPPKKNKKKKSFPDLNKDGKVTQADVLMGRGVLKKTKNGKIGWVEYTTSQIWHIKTCKNLCWNTEFQSMRYF